jgi:segregation and condensation protein A
VRLAAAPKLERVVELDGVSLADLLAAVQEVLEIKPPAPSVNNTVPPITISISEQIDLIARRTARGHSISFRRLLKQATDRLEVIVTLLALLEMVKQLRVTMHQDRRFGDILIVGRESADGPARQVKAG